MKTAFMTMKTNMMMRLAGVKPEKKFSLTKTERGDHLLEVIGTIAIAMVILLLFKDKIVEIFQNAMDHAGTDIEDLFNTPSTPTPTP